MNRKEIQELRELADALQIQADWLAEYQHHWTACEQDAKFLLQIVANVRKAYPSLRARADREERALAGITEDVVDAAARAFNDEMSGPSWLIEADRESLTAALQSAALALQGDRWQPIETAPKDGTRILLGNDAGTWMAEYRPECASGYRPSNPWVSVLLNHDHMRHEGQYVAPARWMPIPAADLSRAIGDSK